MSEGIYETPFISKKRFEGVIAYLLPFWPNRTDRKRGCAVVPRKSRLEYSAAADAEFATALKSADGKVEIAASLKRTPGVPNVSRAS
jgi:hypothetical protein